MHVQGHIRVPKMWVPWVLKGAEKVAILTGIRTHGPLKKVQSYKKENSFAFNARNTSIGGSEIQTHTQKSERMKSHMP